MATIDNPLSAFFRGLQGAQQRAVQQSQQLEENELTRQLRQIQLLNAQRQLAEAAKTPQQRLSEQLTEAVALDAMKRGELVQAPAGLAGQSIALPSAIGQTEAELLAAGTFSPQVSPTPLSISTGSPGLPSLSDALSEIVIPQSQSQETFTIPTAPIKGFEQPIQGLPGFNVSRQAGRERTVEDLARLSEEQRIKAQFTKGNKKALGLTPDSKGVVVQDQSTGDISVEAIPGSTGEGGGIIALPSRTSTSSRGLTANAQAKVLEKAGTARITDKEVAEKYTVNGVTDWNRLILDSNKKISEDKSLAAEEKLKQIPAAERAKATGFIAAHKGLTRLIEEVNKFKVSGKEPDAWNRAVATALEAPPDGIFSALYQSSVGQSLTSDEQTLNALKAMVRSAVTKANAGLSQTEREIANVSQYVPKSNDTIEETLRKGALLETYLIDQVESITTDPKEWLGSLAQGEPIVPRGNNNESQAPSTGSFKRGRFTVTPR